jgi:hypothetical protein
MESTFAIHTDETIPNLPDLPGFEQELAVISKVERQRTEIPQLLHTSSKCFKSDKWRSRLADTTNRGLRLYQRSSRAEGPPIRTTVLIPERSWYIAYQ